MKIFEHKNKNKNKQYFERVESKLQKDYIHFFSGNNSIDF